MSQYSLGTITLPLSARRLITQTLKENRLSYGPFCQEFEQKFAQLHDTKFALFCNSGTAALHTILMALKHIHHWHDGDEVLVPAVTFVATINAVIHAGLKPVLVDIDPSTYNLNPTVLTAQISHKTRAVMPVHLFGQPAAMDQIMAVATKHRLLVIEDSCEAIATKYQGKPVGSWGVAAAFSTHSAHILTTGIGGMITTSDPELAQVMRSLINHGRDTIYISIDDDDDVAPQKLQTVIDGRFCFNHIGYSYRITELEAAIGLAQLEQIDKTIAVRQRNVGYLKKKLGQFSPIFQLPQVSETDTPVYMVFPLVLQSAFLQRHPTALSDLMLHLEKNGIETRPFFPILGQPAYRSFNWKESKFPVAQFCTSAGLYVGCHQSLKRQDLNYLIEQVAAFCRAYPS